MPTPPIIPYLLITFCAGIALGILVGFMASRQFGRRRLPPLVEQARHREREQMACELHDTLLQGIYALSMNVHLLSKQLPDTDPMRARVDSAVELADALARDGRDRLLGLDPARGARQFAEELATRAKAIASIGDVSLSTARSGLPFELPPRVSHEVMRIVGEALMNAVRHAKAKAIELHLDYRDQGLTLVVADDGCGMPSQVAASGAREHIGIATMTQRARSIGAVLGFTAASNGGTRVELWLPMAAASTAGVRQPAGRRAPFPSAQTAAEPAAPCH